MTWTTTNSWTTAPVTLESIKRAMDEAKALLPPPSKLLVGVTVAPDVHGALQRAIAGSDAVVGSPSINAGDLYGVRLDVDPTYPPGTYKTKYADGSGWFVKDGLGIPLPPAGKGA